MSGEIVIKDGSGGNVARVDKNRPVTPFSVGVLVFILSDSKNTESVLVIDISNVAV